VSGQSLSDSEGRAIARHRDSLLNRTTASARPNDMSVVLVTGSYDHEIRFWEAWSGICSRTIARSGESGVSFPNVNLDFLNRSK
jgi:hypothetical protein